MNISKGKSNYLKGIAIILMLAHHLFSFPERISPEVSINYIGILPGTDMYIETYLGLFGRICVAMFLFLSGYGFSLRREVSAKYIFGKLKNLYISYWLVIFIFVPIGIIFYPGPTFSTSITTFIENLIGIKSTYNGEWWFFRLYVLYLLSLPLLIKLNNYTLLLVMLLAAGIGKVLTSHDLVPLFISDYFVWLLPFGLGMVFGRANDFPKNALIAKVLNKIETTPAIWLFLLTAITFILLKNLGLILATPLFISALMKSSEKINATLYGVVDALGRHSMYMWLTHSFYCYHFAQKAIFYPMYTPLILMLLIAVSYLTSVVLAHIERMIKRPFVANMDTAG
ncbi:acyltransferase family protein [Gibbsiella quercinecans]|uniref:acyltransferase family protein n=1 Tax=Gibbsiella quercinecans TaxID=929813 RepID=UPI003A4DE556